MIKLRADELSMFACKGFGALQKPEEFAALLDLVDHHAPKIIMEIGVGNCGSTWAFSKLSSVEHIICIDMPGGPWGGSSKEDTAKRLEAITQASGVPISFISGNSQGKEALEAVVKVLGEKTIDFLFIDGDHSYEGVKTDFLTYSPFVSKPGLIGIHDICVHPHVAHCYVNLFWDEVKASGIPLEEYSEFIAEPDTWGGIGVVRW